MADRIEYGNPMRKTLEDAVIAVNDIIDEGTGGAGIEKVKFTLDNDSLQLTAQQINEIYSILSNYYFVPNRTKEPYIAIENCMLDGYIGGGTVNCNLYIQDGYINASSSGAYSPNYCYTLFKGVVAYDEPSIMNLYILLYSDTSVFYYVQDTPSIIE